MNPAPSGGPDLVAVVSDLHLGQGTRHDHFRDGAAFCEFADHLTDRVRQGSHVQLVVAGDLVDLLPVECSRPARARSTRRAASDRLARIAETHRPVFDALKRFTTSGGELPIIPGNHDVEILWPDVGAALEDMTGGLIEPWIHHVPGLLYVEHGGQYHDMSAFDRFAAPWQCSNPDTIDLPVGSAAALWLAAVNDAVTPAGSLSARAFATSPALVLRLAAAWRAHVHLAATVANGWKRPDRFGRERYRREILTEVADAVGLAQADLAAIDRIAEIRPGALERRVVRAVVRRSGATKMGYARRAICDGAQEVALILERGGQRVANVVMGHTHFPERHSLKGGSTYLNAGTWSSLVPASQRAAGQVGARSFVSIERDSFGNGSARLMRWNPASGSEELEANDPGDTSRRRPVPRTTT